MPELIILADDLSGACEAAATFLLRTTRIQVVLNEAREADAVTLSPVRVLALDSDSRHLPAGAAAARVGQLLAKHLDGAPVALVKKVDSLLRGPLAAEIEQARLATGAQPVVATALPATGRAVVGGVVHVQGTPLAATSLWHAEGRPAPASVPEALAPLPCRVVPLDMVRGDARAFEAALLACAAEGLVPVCDAETDDDLDAVVGAARRALERPLLVGSAGLVAAVARVFPADAVVSRDSAATPTATESAAALTATATGPAPGGRPSAPGVLVAVGSAAPSVGAQVDAVRLLADAVAELDPDTLLSEPGLAAHQVAVALEDATVALLVMDPAAPVRPERSAALAAGLADVAAHVAADRSLVLTGGQTARAVLDALRVTHLEPLAVAQGAVTSRTDEGRLVITRPGSFGTPSSLAELTATLLAGTVSDRVPEGA
jgi:4-hydroxythreonine-4-phosphate dehydrogenase